MIGRVASTNWKQVNLESLYQDTVPESSGVYIICASPPNSEPPVFSRLYEVIYAGQEGVSLRRRFLEHCSRPKPEIQSAVDCLKHPLEYWFTQVGREDLDTLESVLIDCFGPPANKVRKLVIKARLKPAEPA